MGISLYGLVYIMIVVVYKVTRLDYFLLFVFLLKFFGDYSWKKKP